MTGADLAARRGEPSYTWRAGQERRLRMIARWATLEGAHALVAGCGIGMYAAQIQDRFDARVTAFDIERDRVRSARRRLPHAIVAAGEAIPFPDDSFDLVLSHEVIEHVADDRVSARELARVAKPGGIIMIFCPNRWYPFETHGHYWRGVYHFGNTPLINYLPDKLRDKLAPHVRAYTQRGIRRLFADCPVEIIHHARIYGGYDNIIARVGKPAELLRDSLYRCEGTPLDAFALSHFLVLRKR